MSVSVLNTTAGVSGKALALLEGSQTFTGQKTFDVGASAPFVVVSGAAKVTNLDADKLDGQTGVDYHDASLLTGTIAAISGVNLTALPNPIPATSGVNLTALNASNLASGTVATARLGSGTADSTTFLRGDSTWATAGNAADSDQAILGSQVFS